MLIKQIVCLIGALIDTHFYANKIIFSYLSILKALELNRCLWYLCLRDLHCTKNRKNWHKSSRHIQWTAKSTFAWNSRGITHWRAVCGLATRRFINSWVLCFWLNTQQPIWNWALITCKSRCSEVSAGQMCNTTAMALEPGKYCSFFILYATDWNCSCIYCTQQTRTSVGPVYMWLFILIILWSSVWIFYAFTAPNQCWPFHSSNFEKKNC